MELKEKKLLKKLKSKKQKSKGLNIKVFTFEIFS